MQSTAALGVDRFNLQWEDDLSNPETSHEAFGEVTRHVEGEAADAEITILEEYIPAVSNDILKGVTNLSVPEFDALRSFVEPDVAIVWSQSHGRKPTVSG